MPTPPADDDEPLPSVEPVAPPTETPIDTAQREEDAILQSDEGFLIKDAPLNDIFQFLAKQAGRQYFHNVKISTPEYRVTGHLNDGDPLQQMEELAFMYGLELYTKGSTVYALTQTQLTQLPSTEATYKLAYLRPTDIEMITGVVSPVLSPGTGIIKFEPKTNTLVIIDTARRIEKAKELLRKIDQPQGQIIVETKILRINSSAAERVGVDWSGALGETGTTIEIAKSLNSIFGISSDFTDIPNGASGIEYAYDPAANLVLSPVQLSGVLRALDSGGLATQISNPTLITEDNEQGTISIIDRVPIITTTTNSGGSLGGSSVSEEVRYKIDENDPTITEAPEKHREIGISMVATPSLLPDGTIRMNLRPRSAQISEQVRSAQTNNVYPRVTESMIDCTTRVPDGCSLVVGGFYGEVQTNDNNKVPLLGDVPLLNFFFKSKATVKEQTSLVFIVTPTSYDPTSRSSSGFHSNRIHHSFNLPRDHDWVDPLNPGPAHEPNLRRAIRGLQPQEEPYYPTPEEVERARVRHQRVSTSQNAAVEPASSHPRFSRARR
ncbi:type II secretion system protein GspD [Haloferula sargassicola]